MVSHIAARMRIIAVFFGLLTGILVLRLISFQFGQNVAHFEQLSEIVSTVPIIVQSPRGQIYDRNGELLATNEVQYTIGVAPSYVTDPDETAKILSNILGRPYSEMMAALLPDEDGNNPPYRMLMRPAPAEMGRRLLEIREDPEMPELNGVQVEPMAKRTYPNNKLAAHVLGFVNLDNQGYFGLEGFYNELLAGHPVTGQRPVVPFDVALNPEPDYGGDIYITIDRNIQFLVEETLSAALTTYGAQSGTIIVMDPKTGEILAMSSLPVYNPNNYTTETLTSNPAISEQFEPGSGFKVLTMAAAMQSGTVTPESTYFDTGAVEVGGVTIRNWDGGAWGLQDMTGLLRHSLNVGAATLAANMGEPVFYSYMSAFGIGQATNIDLAGEASGRLKIPGDPDWYPSDLGTNAFGQGVATTPIQFITAISAVANGGAMMQPHVLLHVEDGQSTHNTQAQVLGRPISAEVAWQLNEMLANSMTIEASQASVPGYRLAGKTGTAEIPTPYGYSKETIATFVGWGPIDDPQFVVLIKLDKPQTSIWGSQTAAPVFSVLVRRLVVLMGIPPDAVRHQIEAQNAASN